jgi:tRNA-specific 2-thiouridylase
VSRPGKGIVIGGMSGVIDSIMPAFLLKKQGFAVTGVTMRIWDGATECEATRSGCYGPNEAADIAMHSGPPRRSGVRRGRLPGSSVGS